MEGLSWALAVHNYSGHACEGAHIIKWGEAGQNLEWVSEDLICQAQ